MHQLIMVSYFYFSATFSSFVLENTNNCLRLCSKRLSNCVQCLKAFNLKCIYLCKKYEMQTTSAEGQK